MAILTLLLALAFATAPIFSSFDGFDPSLYPIPQEDPPVQPAGWAFSIWGVIYLWLVISAAFGLWRRRDAEDWTAFRKPLCLSLAIGTAWLPVAQVSPIFATVLIWIMLSSAVTALVRAPVRDIWLVRAPVGLYAGWLTAASCVSLGLLAAGYGVLGSVAAASATLILTVVLAAFVQSTRPSAAYCVAIAWASIAIAVQNADGPITLAFAAGGVGIGFLGWAALSFRRYDASPS